MSIYRANKSEDGYCYDCRKEADPLVQCEKCKNWFCTKHVQFVEDLKSLQSRMISLCDAHRGKMVVF